MKAAGNKTWFNIPMRGESHCKKKIMYVVNEILRNL